MAGEYRIPAAYTKECVEVFIVNAKFLGILRPIAGTRESSRLSKRLRNSLRRPPPMTCAQTGAPREIELAASQPATDVGHDWDKICFYISPIGEEGTEQRQHADLFLGSIIEPALEEFGLIVVRADRIGKPGMITAQIIEHVLRSKLVIADLSYHNPNVFYELCLRHGCRLPTVQIIRKADKIPFDLEQFRTIQIDTTGIFSLVPNIQTYMAEIATQVRMALKDPDSTDNPISASHPRMKVTF